MSRYIDVFFPDGKYVEPIHFIDAPGSEPTNELDIRSVVQDRLAAWVYLDLTVTKVQQLNVYVTYWNPLESPAQR